MTSGLHHYIWCEPSLRKQSAPSFCSTLAVDEYRRKGNPVTPANPEIMAAVKRWQANPAQRLNCRRVISHQALEPVDENGRVVLRCLDCDYRQDWIPQAVLQTRDVLTLV